MCLIWVPVGWVPVSVPGFVLGLCFGFGFGFAVLDGLVLCGFSPTLCGTLNYVQLEFKLLVSLTLIRKFMNVTRSICFS